MKRLRKLLGWLSAPEFLQRFHGWATLLWVFVIPTAFGTGLIRSVTFVSVLSLWALVASHWAAWQAARIEAAQVQQLEEMIRRVVEDLILKTTLEASAEHARATVPRAMRPKLRLNTHASSPFSGPPGGRAFQTGL